MSEPIANGIPDSAIEALHDQLYTSRELPQAEWPKLAGTEAADVWRSFDPANTRVLVVEQGGVIVGTWTVLRVVHVECVWIHPAHRGSVGIVKRLLVGMRRFARSWGAERVVTAAVTEQVDGLIRHLGGKQLPGTHYVMPVGKD